MINNFASNFTDLLRIKNVSQTHIAEKLQVRPNTVNQWAKGKREPDLDNLLLISYILDTTPSELLGYKSEIERKEEMIKEAIAVLRG